MAWLKTPFGLLFCWSAAIMVIALAYRWSFVSQWSQPDTLHPVYVMGWFGAGGYYSAENARRANLCALIFGVSAVAAVASFVLARKSRP